MTQKPRPIRSFVRRQGRLTAAQERALHTLWHRFGVDSTADLLDLDVLFGRRAFRVLEIGFGNGDSLAAMAKAHPEADFLGIEVHRPGVGHLLLVAESLDLHNLRILCADAVEILDRPFPDACLNRIQIFFPDPWPKQRHHKRRLIQPAFARLLATKLKPGGHLHLATDCNDYAVHIMDVLESEEQLVNVAGRGQFASRPDYRPSTKFEERGLRLGHQVQDLVFQRR